MPPEADRVPTLLVTGSEGQVGFELRRSLAPLGRVVAVSRRECDLADAQAVQAMVVRVRPDVIVNAAAYTAVDRAESERELAFAVNGTAPGVLAREAAALGSLLIHYSTDYVFDGTKAGFYRETDAVNPRSVYGQSKLAGEQAVADAGGASLILRTSWVAGAYGRNFAKTMLRLARERDSLRVVADQWGAPTGAALIADITAQIIGRHWFGGAPDHSGFPGGLYHLAAAGETSWHGYAVEVLRQAERRGVALRVAPDAVQAIPSSEYVLPAPRPANSRLDTARLRTTFGLTLPDWRDTTGHLLDQILLSSHYA
ncbi:dTDP-4-dehydrorhamnose reductase [Cupriavidus gilardii J11]|uniref:dTDP-4-dehydrorhamnose reductase n=1 Tax=Cupriavidus gilardii J11 TaxID=936133 RepID=A0A562BMB9_9BURK|nr:dTDP-4-dehydrorhamnose reductase [Cupriavidus gilardii]TWG86435.1 dTDP-4-dehydrorhamnose reductase [Cupriavidus gilardii J11]